MKKLLHRVLPFVFVILFCLSANLPIAAAALCADADGDGEITLRDALCVLADPSMAKDPAGATDAARRILRAAATDAPKCGVFYENDFSDPETLADFTAYRGKWSIRSGKLWLDSMDDDSVESSAFLLYSGAETMHLKNYRIDVDIFDVQTQCGVLARCDDAFIRSDAPSNGFRGYYGFVGADADKCAIGYGNAGNGWGGNISTGDAYYLRRGENLHLTMTVFGDRIFATFTNLATGRIEASLVGANGAWTRGGFGFRMRNKYGKTVAVGNTAFDNLRVTVIDESGLPTAENRSIGHIDNNVTDVLFIGNSYTYVNNLPSMVFEMTVAAGVDASFAMFANGGYSLREFYEDLQNGDAEMKEKLSPAHFNQPMVKGAPVVLTFCADFRRFSKWCEQRNAVPGYDNLMSFMNASMDTLLVAQTFCTLAEEAGLGICYLGTTTYNPQMIIDTLQLPELVFPITTITVGYPDGTPVQVDRLPLEAAVHQEVYHDYTPEDIDRLYEYKESLPENKQFIEENKKETLAQVFTDVRYTKKDSEAMSENLWKVMKQQGF